MIDTAISAHSLTKRFGSFTAVNQIDFSVQRGEIFGFLGPNGSGKTTTIRMALGLMKPSSGRVEVLGMEVGSGTSQIRHRTGYMSQRFSLYNDLTVIQNLRFFGTAYGLSNNELKVRIGEALAMAGLEGRQNTKTRDLSGGWRQRLALSAAILHRPEVVFLDEPTAGVDPVSRRVFWDLLYQLAADGITIFVTTHYMDEAEHCQRLAFIQRGTIIAHGTPNEIKQQHMRGQVLEIAPSDPNQALRLLRQAMVEGNLSIQEVELYGALVHIVAHNIDKKQSKINKLLEAAGITCLQNTIIEPSLEDVFISSMKA